jgi:hypothetical protein
VVLLLPESCKRRIATAEYSSAASGSPECVSSRARQAARWVSMSRLPLSWAITRPRRMASRALSGSASRNALP